MNTAYRNRNVFVTDDFDVIEYDSDRLFECYDLTPQLPYVDELIEFLYSLLGISKDQLKSDSDLFANYYEYLSDYWEHEDRSYYSYDEKYEVPMMANMWYYPSFVSFTDSDRLKTVGCITLLYDTELDRWAVAVSPRATTC